MTKPAMTTIMFVCTGNICRSASAELLARTEMNVRGVNGINVTSSGLLKLDPQPMDATAAKYLTRIGIDVSAFRSKPLTPELAQNATVILTFSNRQINQLLRITPDALKKTFLITEFANCCKYALDHQLLLGTSAGQRLEELVQAIPELIPRLPKPLNIKDPFEKSKELYDEAFNGTALAVHRIVNLLAEPPAPPVGRHAPHDRSTPMHGVDA